eukprot:s1612_g8.t1
MPFLLAPRLDICCTVSVTPGCIQQLGEPYAATEESLEVVHSKNHIFKEADKRLKSAKAHLEFYQAHHKSETKESTALRSKMDAAKGAWDVAHVALNEAKAASKTKREELSEALRQAIDTERKEEALDDDDLHTIHEVRDRAEHDIERSEDAIAKLEEEQAEVVGGMAQKFTTEAHKHPIDSAQRDDLEKEALWLRQWQRQAKAEAHDLQERNLKDFVKDHVKEQQAAQHENDVSHQAFADAAAEGRDQEAFEKMLLKPPEDEGKDPKEILEEENREVAQLMKTDAGGGDDELKATRDQSEVQNHKNAIEFREFSNMKALHDANKATSKEFYQSRVDSPLNISITLEISISPSSSAAMERIQRASFWFGRSSVELVILDAEDLKNETTRDFPSMAQRLLQMQNCYDCEKEWPFEEVMGLENLLNQLEDRCGHTTYLSWLRNGRDLHALGLGSNKQERKRAALLALSVACLLVEGAISCHPPVLSKYLAAARTAQVVQLQPAPGQTKESSESWEWRDRPEAVSKSAWLPVSGSWIWWYRESLVVLCEDAQARIFADAKSWFYTAAGVKEEPQSEDLPGTLQQDFHRVLPNIFYTNHFQHGGYSVIALGRDVKHRTRAGCLGLAAQICRDPRTEQMQLTKVQQLVVDEEPLQRFYDIQNHGFWQNMQMWSRCQEQEVPVFSKEGLSDIRMNAQPALLKSLETRQWVEIDLTKSGRPWTGIIKGHQEERKKSLFTRPGIKSFAIASDWNKRDPYQGCPLIFFVVETDDGQRHTFHKLERTDA